MESKEEEKRLVEEKRNVLVYACKLWNIMKCYKQKKKKKIDTKSIARNMTKEWFAFCK